MGLLQEFGQLDVKKGWDVTEIEETNVSKIDGFLIKHCRRNHAQSDEIPKAPQRLPILSRRYTKWV